MTSGSWWDVRPQNAVIISPLKNDVHGVNFFLLKFG